MAVAELYCQAVEAQRSGVIDELFRFDAEPYCWRQYGTKTLKPDAYMRYGQSINGSKVLRHWFLEVDRNQEWGARIASKMPAYLACRADQRGAGNFPRVLFLAPTAMRVDYLKRVVRTYARGDAELFTVVLVDDFLATLSAPR